MRWFNRLYGSNPLHLLVTIAGFALAGYAVTKLRLEDDDVKGIIAWLIGAVVAHDLILFPVYAIADRSIMTMFRRRPPALPAVPWINYLRVPVVFSGILLLMWYPLIFRLPTTFQSDHTGLSSAPYMGRWLAVTGVLFLLSAIAYAIKLAVRGGSKPSGGGQQGGGRQGGGGRAAGRRGGDDYDQRLSGLTRGESGPSRGSGLLR